MTEMYRRCTERVRRVFFFALEKAARLGENRVGTEHLLLGLLCDDDSTAAKTLQGLGLGLETIRSEVQKKISRGSGHLSEDMDYTPGAKHAIDFARQETVLLDQQLTATEGLLLGLIREREGIAAETLISLGADLESTRKEVRKQLGMLQEDKLVSSLSSLPSDLLAIMKEKGGLPIVRLPAELRDLVIDYMKKEISLDENNARIDAVISLEGQIVAYVFNVLISFTLEVKP